MLLAASLAAQQQPARDAQSAKLSGSAVVSGTVFVGPTGNEPARRTRVTLNTTDRGIPGRTTTTDDAGRFAFREVPAGRFILQAVRPGFLTASYGARRAGRPGTAVPVAEGAQVANLTLRIIKGGVITGTAVDGNGQPTPGVSISVLRFTYREMTGERALAAESAASTVTTDDRGIYRAWGLPPGNYVVMATPQLGGGGRAGMATDFQVLTGNDVSRAIAAAKARAAGAVPQPQPPPQRVNYAPVFFPGTPEVGQAATVALKESEERAGIDIPIRLFRTARIDGTVRTADGSPLPQTVPVTLMPGGPQGDLLGARGGSRISTARVDASGKFVFGAVTPGRYAVVVNTGQVVGGRGTPMTATGPNALWAMADVMMDGADATVNLTLQPAMRGAGRVVFEGATEKPKDLTGLRIVLLPPGAGGSLSAGPPGGQVSADGTFTFANVIPGAYRALVLSSAGLSSTGWVLQSATANGRDAWDAWLEVGPGEHLDIVVTYTDRPTQITGTIRDTAGQPVLEPFIVVFPADKSRWVPGSKRLVAVKPGADGQYSVAGLPPGDYLLAALSDVEPGEWNDPAFLETLAPVGIRISLTAGEKKTQNLQIQRENGSTGERENGSTGERENGSTGERENGSTGERVNGSTGERVDRERTNEETVMGNRGDSGGDSADGGWGAERQEPVAASSNRSLRSSVHPFPRSPVDPFSRSPVSPRPALGRSGPEKLAPVTTSESALPCEALGSGTSALRADRRRARSASKSLR